MKASPASYLYRPSEWSVGQTPWVLTIALPFDLLSFVFLLPLRSNHLSANSDQSIIFAYLTLKSPTLPFQRTTPVAIEVSKYPHSNHNQKSESTIVTNTGEFLLWKPLFDFLFREKQVNSCHLLLIGDFQYLLVPAEIYESSVIV